MLLVFLFLDVLRPWMDNKKNCMKKKLELTSTYRYKIRIVRQLISVVVCVDST